MKTLREFRRLLLIVARGTSVEGDDCRGLREWDRGRRSAWRQAAYWAKEMDDTREVGARPGVQPEERRELIG